MSPTQRFLRRGVLHRDSMLARMLIRIPLKLRPFYVFHARVGQDYTSHIRLVWRWKA